MKKIIKIIIPLLLIGIIITPISVRGDYQQTVGETFTYDVVTADIAVNYETNSVSNSSYLLDGQFFNDGTQLEVEVTAVDPANQIDWNISRG